MNNLFKKDKTLTYHSNINIVILSFVSLIICSLNIFLKLKFETTLLKYASIYALIPITAPLILRNFFKLPESIDYKMLIFSNLLLISAFLVSTFTNPNINNFITSLFTNNSLHLYIQFYISACIDIILTSLSDKPLAFCYKLLTSVGLMIAMTNLGNVKGFENSLLAYVVFVVPSCIIIWVTEKKSRICGILSMTVMYCGFVYVGMYMIGMSEDTNHVKTYVDRLREYLPFVNRFM